VPLTGIQQRNGRKMLTTLQGLPKGSFKLLFFELETTISLKSFG